MKTAKVISFVLALMIIFSVASSAMEIPGDKTTVNQELLDEDTTEKTTTTAVSDNAEIMLKDLKKLMDKKGLNNSNFSFAYVDFNRNMKCFYNGDMLFNSYESLKFPLAYLYYDKVASGKLTMDSKIGNDTLKNVYMNSLTKDDSYPTNLLINNYGGLKKVKTDMMKYSKSTMPDEYYKSDKLNAKYCADFLTNYYNSAIYCSTDFKTNLIDPIKEFSQGAYSEKKITDCKITHRYGFSSSTNSAVDIGIVNAVYPFALVIYVGGVNNSEDIISEVAKFAYDFSCDYNSLIVSEATTLPTVAEKDKKPYVANVYSKPLLYIIVGVCVASVIIFAFIYIRRSHRIKKEYRGED